MSLDSFDTELCLYCPDLCLFTCPAVEGSGSITSSPYAKVSALHWAKARPELHSRDTLDLSYLCTDCGLCTEVCEHDQPVSKFLFHHRQDAFAEFRDPDRAAAVLPDEDAGRAVLQEAARLTGSRGSYSVAFFPGCTWIKKGPERIAEVIELLKKVGIVDIAVDPNGPVCCGAPWRNLGDQAGYHGHVASWRRLYARAQGVIIGDPQCERALTEHVSKAFDSHPVDTDRPATRLFPLWNVLIRSLRSPMREKLSMKLAVHESCHENRNADSNKQLQLLQNILDEPPRPLSSIKRQEPCCGCSGSMSETHPDIARNAATALLERAGLAGFEFVLSLSPSCAQHLREAAADRPDLPNTVDIVDLLEQCLRENHGSWGK